MSPETRYFLSIVPERTESNLISAAAAQPNRIRRAFRAAIGVMCWVYVAVLAGVWAVHWAEGDRWWVATMLVYGPKWVWAIPLALLLPLAVFARRRSVWTLLLAALMLAFPIMDLRLPWKRWTNVTPTGPSLRLLTFNTHEYVLDAAGLRLFIGEAQPQVVLLEELIPSFQKIIFADGPWHVVQDAQFCIGSRYPIRRNGLLYPLPHRINAYAARYEIDTPQGAIPLVIVHLASPHLAFAATLHQDPKGPLAVQTNSALRLAEAREVRRLAALSGPAVVMAGDFNLPTDSRTYQSEFTSFKNAFDDAGLGFGWTYDVKLTITRIDHILTGSGWQARRSWLGPVLGSPHRPLLADLEFIGGSLAEAPRFDTPPTSAPVAPLVARNAVTAPAVPTSSTAAAVAGTPAVASTTPSMAAVTPATVPSAPATRPVDPAIILALRDHHLAIGMTIDQARQALNEWEGPAEVPATLHSGWKLYRWKKGDERLGAAFDAEGLLRSFQRI